MATRQTAERALREVYEAQGFKYRRSSQQQCKAREAKAVERARAHYTESLDARAHSRSLACKRLLSRFTDLSHRGVDALCLVTSFWWFLAVVLVRACKVQGFWPQIETCTMSGDENVPPMSRTCAGTVFVPPPRTCAYTFAYT